MALPTAIYNEGVIRKEALKMMEIIQGKYEKAKRYYESFHTDYFEFEFVYVPQDSHLREIDRFRWESRYEKTRFKNVYKGDVLIDLTEWNDAPDSSHFDAFMYFLKDKEEYNCTFLVRNTATKSLKKKLEEFFDLSLVDFSESQPCEMRTIGFVGGEKEDANV